MDCPKLCAAMLCEMSLPFEGGEGKAFKYSKGQQAQREHCVLCLANWKSHKVARIDLHRLTTCNHYDHCARLGRYPDARTAAAL